MRTFLYAHCPEHIRTKKRAYSSSFKDQSDLVRSGSRCILETSR